MSWRIVIIENQGKLSSKNNQLIFKTKSNTKSIPLEDIDFIILDNRQIIITHPLMNKLLEMGIILIITNEKHEANGVLISYWNQYKKLETLEKQLNISIILKKQIWKEIIKQKVLNQNLCLEKYNIDSKEIMEKYKKIKTYDKSNIESSAAALYFKKLFSNEEFKFTRQDHKSKKISTLNAALNYTYSIIRATIIKYIVIAGFIPYLGIFHKSKTNPFNLADDLIESFRPIADYHVYKYKDKLIEHNFNKLDSSMRKEMQKIYLYEVYIDNKWTILSNACKIVTSSFLQSINKNNYELLKQPYDWRNIN